MKNKKSILQKEKYCILCGRNGHDDPLDRHHVFFGAYRNKSEEYGLTVWLCHDSCHIFGENSVHKNIQVNRILQQHAQKVAMRKFGWTTEQFIEIFGRNYIED